MNLESFKTTIQNKRDVLFVIDFTAEWCGPCKRISPFIDELETMYNINNQQLIQVIKVDVDKNVDIVSEFNISRVPTFVFIKNSVVVGSTACANIDAVNELIKKNLQS